MILRGTVYSKTLKMDTKISVVVPNIFRRRKAFKVVYLLHGLMGDCDSWVDYTMLPVFAQEQQTVVIMPSVDRSFYADMKHGPSYFSYVAQELPQICESVFHISAKREDTAVIGGSMGGYGALKCALAYPERFGYGAALSPGALFLGEYFDDIRKKSEYKDELTQDFKNIFGENLDWAQVDDLLTLAGQTQTAPQKPKLYCACGLEDVFLSACRRFDSQMNKLALDFTYEEQSGGHDWYFFNQALKRALEFWKE